VARRTQEIGIRTALGAPRNQVLSMILRRGFVLALCGAGAGALAALWITRYLKSLLSGVPATDTVTFLAVSVLLVGVVASELVAGPASDACGSDRGAAVRVSGDSREQECSL